MLKKDFMRVLDCAIESGNGISVEVKLPHTNETEHIQNLANNVVEKKEYYNKAYNDNMQHNNDNAIEIISVFEIKVTYADLLKSYEELVHIASGGRMSYAYAPEKVEQVIQNERIPFELYCWLDGTVNDYCMLNSERNLKGYIEYVVEELKLSEDDKDEIISYLEM